MTSFYFYDEDTMNIWVKYLRPLVINIDINDQYKFIKVIYSGEISTVWEIEHRKTKCRYAVKKSKKKLFIKKPIMKKVFRSEIRILRKINDESCLKIYEVHQFKKCIFIITELLEGCSLIDYKIRKGNHLKFIIKQILESVRYLHSLGYVHRDIKLSNFVLRNNYEAFYEKLVLIDFGLSFEESQNIRLEEAGTPGYLPPEAFLNWHKKRGELNIKIGKAVDIFAIGSILYGFLADIKLYAGDGFDSILKNNYKGKIEFSHIEKPQNDINIIDDK